MKKKLEAELISIAHRILKLKNRAELDQLQQETLKLYEKISVLRFVEDNFSGVKPTIGYSSAEETLEEIYGIEETPEVRANDVEAEEEKARAEKKAEQAKDKDNAPEQDKENKDGEGVVQDKEDSPVSGKEKEGTEDSGEEVAKEDEPKEANEKPEEVAKDNKKVEAPAAEETEIETEQDQVSDGDEADNNDEAEETDAEGDKKAEASKDEVEEKPETEEPEVKVQVEKPEQDVKAMEEGAAAVFEKEEQSTLEEEEQAADAEIITITPDANAKVEASGVGFDFAFERPAAPEAPVKQKEITFEDYHDYKEPEFVKKDADKAKDDAPKDEAKQEYKDWRDWEPSKTEEPKEEVVKPEPAKEEPKQEESNVKGNVVTRSDFDKPKSLNDSFGKSITLGLNDRIAFEKNLFGGSADDLNRVLSQLATINTFDEAKDFITDLVKPDYNNWNGKEEYEERFMAIVEKKFN